METHCIQHRTASIPTHKYIRFSHAQSKNGWGFKVHNDSPRDLKSEDAGGSLNPIYDLPQEEQADVSAMDLHLLDVNSMKRLEEDLDSASGSKKRRIIFEPHREENAMVDTDVAMKVRHETKKLYQDCDWQALQASATL